MGSRYHDQRSSGSRMSPPHEEMLRLWNMQQLLLLLRHALICPYENGKCRDTEMCADAKKLRGHAIKCKEKQCKVPCCLLSRFWLSHCHGCKDRHCQLCEPVRDVILKTKAKAKRSTDKDAAVQYELQLLTAALRDIMALASGSSSSPSGQNAKTPTKNSSDKVGRTHPKAHSANEQSSSVTEAKRGSDAEEKAKQKRAIMDAPFDMLEEIYQTRKRAKTTIDLTNDEKKDGSTKPDGSGAALRDQVEQQQLLVAVKKEKDASLEELRQAQSKVSGLESQLKARALLEDQLEEAKKAEAKLRLNLEQMKECIICQDADKCLALFPCAHLALCTGCKVLNNECPICRATVDETRKINVA